MCTNTPIIFSDKYLSNRKKLNTHRQALTKEVKEKLSLKHFFFLSFFLSISCRYCHMYIVYIEYICKLFFSLLYFLFSNYCTVSESIQGLIPMHVVHV